MDNVTGNVPEGANDIKKKPANRFKQAAEKKRVSPGGIPEELTAGTVAENPTQVQAAPAQVVEEQIPAPIAEPAAPAESTPAAQVAPEAPVVVKTDGLVATYELQRTDFPEARVVRLQAVITPSLNAKLNALVSEQKIKSKNDLVNYLLERYLEEYE